MGRKAKRSDVLDELRFIASDERHYTAGQRKRAEDLHTALIEERDWNPGEMYLLVIAILEGHNIEIPKIPCKI